MSSRHAHGDLTALIRDFADGVTRLPRRGGIVEVFANLDYTTLRDDEDEHHEESDDESIGLAVVQTLRITAASADENRFLLQIVQTLEAANGGDGRQLVDAAPGQQYLVAKKDLGDVLRVLQPEPCALLCMTYGCRLRLVHGAVDLKSNIEAVKEACTPMTYLMRSKSYVATPHIMMPSMDASVGNDIYANFAAIRTAAGKYADMIKVLPL
ncbi:hypothetical protein M885DRAFT_524817 [Pelagophyceae sp. CCMP2097]|nr:hypothetical protein M885DRAFT_524817 [Pelagophyceae sp. CCMP2097]